ncbi:hypothetical protein JR316_0011399 [Psilocybe cubensis]|uniref:Glucose-methanol-choline oxidoreductase C-terminal domain-containing protein n=2 Tax=Psilocybe cubensis TaxID=181762 RepID=A0A8H7XSL2_PSICU|nr:hypothetical protein JR316_0011399 [Psilocybe cubensis]KAH9475839.1 hypothetical protein JR316_0011399 [Psilocybe cubensis]
MNPVGTVAMSMADDPSGVVDPQLLVKGADGLRIIDASVFVSSQTALPVFYAFDIGRLLAQKSQYTLTRARVLACRKSCRRDQSGSVLLCAPDNIYVNKTYNDSRKSIDRFIAYDHYYIIKVYNNTNRFFSSDDYNDIEAHNNVDRFLSSNFDFVDSNIKGEFFPISHVVVRFLGPLSVVGLEVILYL